MNVFHRGEEIVIGILCVGVSANPHTASATYAQLGDEGVYILLRVSGKESVYGWVDLIKAARR